MALETLCEREKTTIMVSQLARGGAIVTKMAGSPRTPLLEKLRRLLPRLQTNRTVLRVRAGLGYNPAVQKKQGCQSGRI